MESPARTLSRGLAEHVEAVCKHYLSNGRRCGNYWIVGDVNNNAGRSLYVRLKGPLSGKGARGKWTDSRDGEHGDLLDLIRAREGLRFLPRHARRGAALFAGAARDADGETVAIEFRRIATRSRSRAKSGRRRGRSSEQRPRPICVREKSPPISSHAPLRYHPALIYRERPECAPSRKLPALVAAVTDNRRRDHGHSSDISRSGAQR